MVNFVITKWISVAGTIEAVTALMEVQLETVDNGKTIIVANIYQLSDNRYQAVLVYTT